MYSRYHTLQTLIREARAEFSAATFWNIATLDNPADEARNIGRQLAKHGGMRGLRFAANIEKALLAAREPSWR